MQGKERQMIHALFFYFCILAMNILTDHVQLFIICDMGSAEDISNLTNIPFKNRPLLLLVSGCLLMTIYVC